MIISSVAIHLIPSAHQDSCLCARAENSAYHALKCLQGKCPECGVQNLPCCPRKVEEESKYVTVKIFKDVDVGVDKKGKKKKRKILSFKEMM